MSPPSLNAGGGSNDGDASSRPENGDTNTTSSSSDRKGVTTTTTTTDPSNNPPHTDTQHRELQSYLPPWVDVLRPTWGHRLVVSEWHDPRYHGEDHDHEEHRSAHGWHGSDLIHDMNSPVRISEYWASYRSSTTTSTSTATATTATESGTSGDGDAGPNSKDVNVAEWDGVGTTLTGVCHFTTYAESHRGYSHGGAACSIMDDAVGWTGFLVSGSLKPWSGYTAQINTRLCRPIRVGSVLLVKAEIVRREGRKVYVEVRLVDPGTTGDENGEGEEVVHATCEGLFVLNRPDADQQQQGQREK